MRPEPAVRNLGCETTFRESGPAPTPAGCSGRRRIPARKVFLANGDTARLLEKYFDEAETKAVPLDPERLSVIYIGDDAEQHLVEAPRLSLGQMLAGKSERDLWSKVLSGKVAQPRSDATADARKLYADVVCGD